MWVPFLLEMAMSIFPSALRSAVEIWRPIPEL